MSAFKSLWTWQRVERRAASHVRSAESCQPGNAQFEPFLGVVSDGPIQRYISLQEIDEGAQRRRQVAAP
jgi:hypothetical protein